MNFTISLHHFSNLLELRTWVENPFLFFTNLFLVIKGSGYLSVFQSLPS